MGDVRKNEYFAWLNINGKRRWSGGKVKKESAAE